jgi:hypothetical protein
MSSQKILAVVWVIVLIAGVLGLVYPEISFTRTDTTRLGPIEIEHPSRSSIEIPRPLALGAIAVGAGMTLYSIFFKLK